MTSAPADDRPGHPDLHCPFGTLPEGHAPPRGLEVWCVKHDPSGEPEKHGPSIEWQYPATLLATGSWFGGEKQGEWTWYYPNGQFSRVEHWAEGALDGAYVEYAPYGGTSIEGGYAAGEPDGTWTWFREDGTLERTGGYIDGQKHGEWFEYDPQGKPLTRRLFRNGRQTSQEFFLPPRE
ncbi:MAG: hypothetical protein JRJ84_13490 [Deltaproteobacteria bacterium]|nr:hypothetical protein [Deltaproteobacteria bacterium]